MLVHNTWTFNRFTFCGCFTSELGFWQTVFSDLLKPIWYFILAKNLRLGKVYSYELRLTAVYIECTFPLSAMRNFFFVFQLPFSLFLLQCVWVCVINNSARFPCLCNMYIVRFAWLSTTSSAQQWRYAHAQCWWL